MKNAIQFTRALFAHGIGFSFMDSNNNTMIKTVLYTLAQFSKSVLSSDNTAFLLLLEEAGKARSFPFIYDFSLETETREGLRV